MRRCLVSRYPAHTAKGSKAVFAVPAIVEIGKKKATVRFDLDLRAIAFRPAWDGGIEFLFEADTSRLRAMAINVVASVERVGLARSP